MESQLDSEEDVDIWLEGEDSRRNILRTTDETNKTIIRAANLNKLVQVLFPICFCFVYIHERVSN
jgi:hypothetical protein